MSDRQIMVQILGDAASLERAFAKSAAAANTFDARMTSLGKKTTSIGKTMTRDVTLPLTAAGVASVKMAQNFDLLISRMVGLGGVTEAQSKKFRQFILDLAPKVGKGPEELANGLYQIVSAGVKGQRALDALTVSAKASAAGLGDTATVADAVTSVMNAYAKTGMTAATAANVLSAAVRDGKGEASSFAPVLGKVVAVAAQLGVPFDQAAAALAQMTKLGVPADDAATQLSATFSELLKTTPKAEKALEAMGLSAAGLREELREKGLLATLQTLAEKTHGSTVAMAEAFPNVRALRGVLQLVGSSASGTAQTFDDVKNSTKSLSTAFGAASKTDAFKMQQSLAQLKVAAVDLGTALAPMAEAVAKDVEKMSKAFEDLSPHEKDVLIKLAEFAAVGGPLVLMTGKMITATGEIAKMAKALRGLAAAEAAAGTAGEGAGLLALLTRLGPLGIAAAAIGGAAYGTARDHKVELGTSGARTYSTENGKFYVTNDRGATVEIPRSSVPAAIAAKVPDFTGGGNSGAEAAASPGRSGSGRQTYGYAQLKGLWESAGGDAGVSDIMAAIAIAESSGRSDAKGGPNSNGTFDYGCWQINSSHGYDTASLLAADQSYNARCAVSIYHSQGLGAWSTYNSGAYKRYLKGSGTTHSGAGSGSGDSTYDPLAASKGAKAKGATQATIISEQGHIAAMLKGLPSTLDPVEKNAVAHIKQIQDDLHIHMTPAELAKDKVELAKWGKVLHDEVSKNAKKAAEAAAEAKKTFDRALALDVSHVLRDFDESFQRQLQGFDKDTSRHLKDMQTAFSLKQAAFDRETQQGLAQFVVAQTPEEKALADFLAKRAADDQAASRADQLANAATPEERAQLALGFSLDDQQAALQAAADASRVAQNAKTEADQQAYQDQRDAAKQAAQDKETDAEQSYQDLRDGQKQALQDLNDDQRTALQNSLDDWTANLEAKKAKWTDFVNWLQSHGYSTDGLVNPNTGQPTSDAGGGGSSNQFGTLDPGIAAKLGIASAPDATPDALSRYLTGRGMIAAANGAIVTRPTVAIDGHEPEGVFPLSVLAGMLGGGGGLKTIEVPVILDKTELARLIVDVATNNPTVGRGFAKAADPHLSRIVKTVAT